MILEKTILYLKQLELMFLKPLSLELDLRFALVYFIIKYNNYKIFPKYIINDLYLSPAL